MRDCDRHPFQSQPGGGVCASCLKERLARLWRGEIFRPDDPANPTQTGSQEQGEAVHLQLRDDACPPVVGVGCLASVRKQRDPREGDGGDSKPTHPKDVMVEWAEFHARRRRRRDLEPLPGKLNSNSSPMVQMMSRSLDSIGLKPFVDQLMDPNRSQVSAQKVRSRSMPLDNRSAEETALRVIREQGDHLYSDELDFLESADGDLRRETPEQLCRFWQSGPKTPKWVKLLVSPMTTSRNKVFPSKGDVRKGRKRLTRFASADWSPAGARWIPMSLGEHPGGHQRRRSSSCPWLQDAERTKTKKYEPPGHRITLSAGSADLWLSDLTTVGHLHEIAEEQEIVEESSEEEDHNLGAISSFGKFLLRAAERQPKAGLTRLASAA